MVRTIDRPRRADDDRPRQSYGDEGRGNQERARPRNDRRGPYRELSPRRRDSWRPDAARRPREDSAGSQLYGQRPPQSDFTFSVQQPPGIAKFRQNDGTGSGHEMRNGRRDRRGSVAIRRQPGRRWQPPHPSQRALVSGTALNLPEERLNDDSVPARFRALDELSDDEELDMDISSHSSYSDAEKPSKKRLRIVLDTDAAANAAPKWSNPDPYTALPCPDDSTQKKTDVLKLIRKARVEEEKKPATSAQAEDFISFDLSSDDEHKFAPSAQMGKVQALNGSSTPTSETQVQRDPLGSRKRTVDDEIKPPDYFLTSAKMKPVKGLQLMPAWQPKQGEDPCPWTTTDHSATSNMPLRLHKEIVDFYEYVRPRQFEQEIREYLVSNLNKAMRRDGRNFASAELHPFGSFMSGLYLPTADMDLVVCSASYMRGGPPTYLGSKSWLYKFQKLLVAQGLADQGSITIIAHARVPLVKFVDKLTGLRVDVSFENLGGVEAIKTFQQWRHQYPSMPLLVTIIKHYLLMRGLNEPVNGGIGGFSVICLVISMLQLMPQVQSRSLIPEHHLGEMLLEFFDLYGRQFQHETSAISLTRPVGYVRKHKISAFTYKNQDRLSIIDPNNPANDIAGGSHNTVAILARFHDAYNMLRDRMIIVAKNPSEGGILDVILKGDYSSFRQQRNFLQHVYEKALGPCPDPV